jgi:hypothetical protein
VKTVDFRRTMILGGILAATLSVGCFGGGGYSNQPYGYNGGAFGSNRYDNGYGNPYPYDSGYNDTHSYPQSFGNSNAYVAGLHDRQQAGASRDRHEGHVTQQHVEVTHDREQARTEKHSSSIDH